MFRYRNADGSRNISGKNIARVRKAQVPKMSQRDLAQQMQLRGIDLDRNAIQRIEKGKRYVLDAEVQCIADILGVPVTELMR